MMKHRCVFSVLIFILTGILPSSLAGQPQNSQKLEKVVLQLKWYHQFQSAGYYAAQKNGYYAEEGLDVTFREISADRKVIPSVLTDEATYGVTDADVLLAWIEGKPIVVLGAIFQHSPYVLLTRYDSGIRTPANCIGRTVMISDEGGHAQIQAMFKKEGIPLDSIHFVKHSWNISDLIDKKVDVISAYSTDEVIRLKDRGIEPFVINPLDYGIDFYGDVLITSEKEATEYPDRASAFRRASFKGWEYAMSHVDEIIDEILSMEGVQSRGITRRDLEYEAKQMRQFILPDMVEIGHMNRGRWEHMAQAYHEFGLAPRVVSLDGFMFEPASFTTTKTFYIIVGVGLGVVLLAIFLIAINKQLRRMVAKQTLELRNEVDHRRLAEEELLQLHNELQNTYDLLHNITEGTRDLIVALDLQFKFIAFNAAYKQEFEKIFGRTPEIGMTIGDALVHLPEEQSRVMELWRRALHGEEFTVLEEFGDASRQRNVYEITYSAIRDIHGNQIGASHVGRDITEKKRTEDTIRHSEQRLSLLFKQSPLAVIEWDPDFRVKKWNAAAERIFGYSEAEALNAAVSLISSPDDQTPLSAMFENAARNNVDVHESHTNQTKDGRSVVCDWYSTPLFDLQGRVMGYVSMAVDITERKKMEIALQVSEEKFSKAFHTSPDAVNINRLQDGLFIEINDGFSALTGFTWQDVQGKTSKDINLWYYPDDRGMLVRSLEKNGEVSNMEFQFRRKDGSLVTGLISAKVIELNGEKCVLSITRDITERKETQEKILRQKEQFEQLFDSSPLAIAMLDQDDRIVAINRGFTAIFQYGQQEVEGKLLNELIVPEELMAEANELSRSTLNGHSVERETVRRRKDGSSVYVAIYGAPSLKRGTRVGVYGIYVDITERKRFDVSLKKSEEEFRHVWEDSFDGMRLTDSAGTMLSVNNAFCRLVRKPREALIGEHFSAIFQVPYDEERQALQRERFRKRLIEPYLERELILWDGRRVWFELSNSYIEIEGHPPSLLSIFRDISERKLAEERTREQAALLDVTSDAIIVEDVSSDKVLYWNNGTERMYGYSKDTVTDAMVATSASADWVLTAAEIKKTILENGEWRGVLTQARQNGAKLIVDSRRVLVRDKAGNPRSILIVNTDITESRMLQDRFLRAQRLESIGVLAGGIAHDLNNVLSPIMMGVEILKNKLTDTSLQRYIHTLELSAERGANIVKQVLTFARGVDGERVWIHPKHLVEETKKFIEETFPKSISIETSISKNPWLLKGDRTQLHQVLLNLCVNARDAMPKGGKLTIKIDNVVLTAKDIPRKTNVVPGSFIRLSVIDTGVGIPKDHFDKIFEAFFTTKDIGAGTGLGLSTVYGIVKSHGGFVDLESEMGKGSTFKVYVPAVESEGKIFEQDQLAAQDVGNGEMILVIDDESSVREILKETLEAYGFRAMTAKDGLEGVELFRKHQLKIDLVLTDIMMPHMDGPTMISALKRINPNVKVVAMSGFAPDETLSVGLEYGSIKVLTKPFTASTLLTTLSGILREM